MKIMIALDGSDAAAAALAPAATLARKAGAELLLVNAFSPFVEMGHASGSHDERLAHVTEERRAYLEKLADTAPGVSAQVLVAARRKTEDPDECIARVAGEQGADMLVVASKRASGVGGLVLGSTAQGLLRMSPCPVLVVRPA